MHIGIVVHSNSGHTLRVASELRRHLDEVGHSVRLEELEASAPVRGGTTEVISKTIPSLDECDTVVLGSPVNGGQMSGMMRGYLSQVPSLEGKRVAFLLTHFFPQAWGTRQTIEEMANLCESKGASVVGWADVRWPNLRRRQDIATAVEKLMALVSAPDAAMA